MRLPCAKMPFLCYRHHQLDRSRRHAPVSGPGSVGRSCDIGEVEAASRARRRDRLGHAGALALVDELPVVLLPGGCGSEDESVLPVGERVEDHPETVSILQRGIAAAVGDDESGRIAVVADDAEVDGVCGEDRPHMGTLGRPGAVVREGLLEPADRRSGVPGRITEDTAVENGSGIDVNGVQDLDGRRQSEVETGAESGARRFSRRVRRQRIGLRRSSRTSLAPCSAASAANARTSARPPPDANTLVAPVNSPPIRGERVAHGRFFCAERDHSRRPSAFGEHLGPAVNRGPPRAPTTPCVVRPLPGPAWPRSARADGLPKLSRRRERTRAPTPSATPRRASGSTSSLLLLRDSSRSRSGGESVN